MLRIRDDKNRLVHLMGPPRRVVSLVPSDTLNVCAVGGASALVGRTDYCDLPADVVAKVPSVGGTKNPRVKDVLDLKPELVLANQEENTRSDLEALAQAGVKVLVAFPKRVGEGLAHLARLARVFGVATDPAVKLLVKQGYDALARAEAQPPSRRVRVFCPIWMDPLMTIHETTFISDMLRVAGADNVFADRERRYPLAADVGTATPLPKEKLGERDVRYPRVTLDEVKARAPELVLLPDEPHPFTEDDAKVFRALFPERPSAVRFVSGKDLCWYGARSVEGIDRVRGLLGGEPSR
jgi:ABC-type Fe3+-hydroxamate transport system substrate-binding protein